MARRRPTGQQRLWRIGSSNLRIVLGYCIDPTLNEPRVQMRGVGQFEPIYYQNAWYIYNHKTSNIIGILRRPHNSWVIHYREASWYSDVFVQFAEQRGLVAVVSNNIARRSRAVGRSVSGVPTRARTLTDLARGFNKSYLHDGLTWQTQRRSARKRLAKLREELKQTVAEIDQIFMRQSSMASSASELERYKFLNQRVEDINVEVNKLTTPPEIPGLPGEGRPNLRRAVRTTTATLNDETLRRIVQRGFDVTIDSSDTFGTTTF